MEASARCYATTRIQRRSKTNGKINKEKEPAKEEEDERSAEQPQPIDRVAGSSVTTIKYFGVRNKPGSRASWLWCPSMRVRPPESGPNRTVPKHLRKTVCTATSGLRQELTDRFWCSPQLNLRVFAMAGTVTLRFKYGEVLLGSASVLRIEQFPVG